MAMLPGMAVQRPSSAAVGASAPSATFNSAAPPDTATGSSRATTHQPRPTRQRIMRRSKPRMPALPSVRASTTSAARNGPKLAIGIGIRPNVCRGHGHHDRRKVNTKNATSRMPFDHVGDCRNTARARGPVELLVRLREPVQVSPWLSANRAASVRERTPSLV